MLRLLAVVALLGAISFVPGTRERVVAASAAERCNHAAVTQRLATRPVVAFGDGVTWGVNGTHNCVRSSKAARPASAHLPAASDTTYPADLARLLHTTVLDYGVRGETTEGGLKRIARVLAATQPREVLVLEGYQDLLHGDTPAVISARLILIAQIIQSYGAQPVLLTLYAPTARRPSHARVRALDAFIRNQGRIRGVRVIDLADVFHGQKHVLAGGLYPVDKGYRLLAVDLSRALGRRHT